MTHRKLHVSEKTIAINKLESAWKYIHNRDLYNMEKDVSAKHLLELAGVAVRVELDINDKRVAEIRKSLMHRIDRIMATGGQ